MNTDKEPILSVLIPCYNHQNYIEETIRSIWEQDIKNIQIIAIDDGSKDETYKKLQQLQKISPFEMIIKSRENKGVTKTLNEALSLAKGKYIATIASDDKYIKNSFKYPISILQNDSNIKVLYVNGYGFNEKEIIKQPKVHTTYTQNLLSKTPFEIYQEIILNVPRPLLTQAAIFSKDMLLDIKGWDEDLKLDDWPLNIKIFKYLAKNNYSHKFIDYDMILYRDHSAQTHKQGDFNFQIIQEVINKYTPEDKRNSFLSKEMRFRAKMLFKENKKQEAIKMIKTALKTDFHIYNIIKSLEILIKYTLKNRKTV